MSTARKGDHICYISNLAKFKSHYPDWQLSKSLDNIFREIVFGWEQRLAAEQAGDGPSRRQTLLAESEPPASADKPLIEVLAQREEHRDRYFRERDPIGEDRLRWRAQTFRHLVHLLPGQTILILGAGQGLLAAPLAKMTRGENPITAVTFDPEVRRPEHLPASVEFLQATSLPGPLENRRFDFVAGIDVMDDRNSAWLLTSIQRLLEPGGQMVLFESNPWNPLLSFRRALLRLIGKRDPRRLLSRTRLYELISELGFIRVFAVHTDFVYAP